MAVRVVMVGPPGSGKGTQGTRLAAHFGVPHIASGDILRRIIATEDSDLARAARVINDGKLISDEVANAIVFREMDRPNAANGFVLDGYPRTVAQAEALDAFLAERGKKLGCVVALEVAEAELIDRLSGRLTCSNCGASFHLRKEPPRVSGICDVCGNALTVRADDDTDGIRMRLGLFRERTEPLFHYYRESGRLVPVDGVGDEDAVFQRIREALKGRKEP